MKVVNMIVYYLLNETVCNDKQKWNKDGCKCECLKLKECEDNSIRKVVNCKCEHKKAAKLIAEEKCDEMVDDVLNNKTILIIKKVENCKPYVASSILFVSGSIIVKGIIICC